MEPAVLGLLDDREQPDAPAFDQIDAFMPTGTNRLGRVLDHMAVMTLRRPEVEDASILTAR